VYTPYLIRFTLHDTFPPKGIHYPTIGFVSFSSQIIAQSGRSRSQYHWQAFEQLRELVGGKPLVLDRDFSSADLLEYMTAAGIHFVASPMWGQMFSADRPCIMYAVAPTV
jgi:hypothetical protein